MQSWIFYGFGSALSFAVMTLAFRMALHTLPTLFVLPVVFSAVSLLTWSFAILRKVPLTVNKQEIAFLTVAGIAAFIGNICDLEAIRLSPNPGYASALKSGQIIFITLASVVLFENINLSIQGFLGVTFVLLGVILLATIR